jgi:hypothetical protein
VVAPLGGVGLAEDDQAGVQIAVDDPGRLGRHVTPQRARAHHLGRACQRGAEILEQERNAGQRAGRSGAQCTGVVECGGLPPTSVEEVGDDGVESAGRVETGDGGVE